MAALANKRRELFCREYVKTFNGTAAAKLAGYKPGAAQVTASMILCDPMVTRRVEELKEARWRSMEMSDAELRARIAATARFDPRRLKDAEGNPIPLHKLDDETAWALTGVDIEERTIREQDGDEEALISVRMMKYRAADKNKAQEMLSRMANLFKQDTSNAADSAVSAFAQVLGGMIGGQSGLGNLIEPAALPAPLPNGRPT